MKNPNTVKEKHQHAGYVYSYEGKNYCKECTLPMNKDTQKECCKECFGWPADKEPKDGKCIRQFCKCHTPSPENTCCKECENDPEYKCLDSECVCHTSSKECRACETEKPFKLSAKRHTCPRNPSPENHISEGWATKFVSRFFVYGIFGEVKDHVGAEKAALEFIRETITEARTEALREAIAALQWKLELNEYHTVEEMLKVLEDLKEGSSNDG